MKPLILSLLLCSSGLAVAGDPTPAAPAGAAGVPSAQTDGDAWQFTLSPYGWLVNLDGTLGIRGFTTPLDVGFVDILNNLDMVALLNMEVRKGRWGGWLDIGYLDLSVGDNPSGPLFDSLGISMQQALVEGAVFYRALDGKRGFLDVYAGARYFNISSTLELSVSDEGLREVSQNLSQGIVDQLLAAVKAKAEPALSTAASRTADKLATEAKSSLVETVSQKASAAKTKLNDLHEIAAAHPELAEKLRNSAALQEALRNVASAQLEAKRLALEQKAAGAGALKSGLQAAVNRAKSKAEKALNKAEQKLAQEIEDALATNIPNEISGSYEWIDPFVGVRARYNFTDRFYGVAKADIGGFGVGSDLAWQVYGAFGFHLTKSGKTTLEVGYRHMAIDYSSGDFIYDANMSGAMVSLGFTF